MKWQTSLQCKFSKRVNFDFFSLFLFFDIQMSNELWTLLSLSFTLVVRCTLYKKKTEEQWISGIIIVMGGTCVKHELLVISRNVFLNTPVPLIVTVEVYIYSTIITLVIVKIALECREKYTHITYIYMYTYIYTCIYIHIHIYAYTTIHYCTQNGNIEVNVPKILHFNIVFGAMYYFVWFH